MPTTQHKPLPTWNVTAAIAAWLLPGLGHCILGERRRGSILATTIGITWLAGLLISGISAIDRTVHPNWFLGQMLMAPSVVVNFGHQLGRQTYDAYDHGDRNPKNITKFALYEPSFGHIYEQGMLYTLLAGLMNLLAILDVLCRHPVHGTPKCPAPPNHVGRNITC